MLLSVCTFGRVFDVTPAVDALTLTELGEALTRFQLKGELARREERDLDRARKVARGEGEVDAPMKKRLDRHLKRHDGEPDAAARALADLERDIRREAKQDFRLWAPALFAPGAKREDEHVVHLSALVLDLDKGPAPEAVREAFADCWHVAHSTWSHQAATPKLRLIVPFSAPVRPGDFEAIWHFADARVGHRSDPTGRALARAWGLPAVPYADRERLAWIHEAPLFDPFALGLASAPEPSPVPAPTHHSFLRRDPGELYLPPTAAAGPALEATPEFDPWDGGGAIRRTPSEPSRVAPGPAADDARSPSARPGSAELQLGSSTQEPPGSAELQLGISTQEPPGSAELQLGISTQEPPGSAELQLGSSTQEPPGSAELQLGSSTQEPPGSAELQLGSSTQEPPGSAELQLGKNPHQAPAPAPPDDARAPTTRPGSAELQLGSSPATPDLPPADPPDRVASLEARVAALEARLAALEQRLADCH